MINFDVRIIKAYEKSLVDENSIKFTEKYNFMYLLVNLEYSYAHSIRDAWKNDSFSSLLKPIIAESINDSAFRFPIEPDINDSVNYIRNWKKYIEDIKKLSNYIYRDPRIEINKKVRLLNLKFYNDFQNRLKHELNVICDLLTNDEVINIKQRLNFGGPYKIEIESITTEQFKYDEIEEYDLFSIFLEILNNRFPDIE